MTIKSNQYGFPCKTYYYIVNDKGQIYHKDGKWRKKALIQIWDSGFKTEDEAKTIFDKLQNRIHPVFNE